MTTVQKKRRAWKLLPIHADTGRFVTTEQARRNPKTVVWVKVSPQVAN